MKRFFPYIALLALVAMVGCSADSPRARPAPTVVPEAWSISSLDASSTAPFVGTVILVEATVTLNGSPAPDDTTITFEAAGTGGAFGNGTTTASVLTDGGTASVAFISQTEGTFVIRARVSSASRELSIEYQDRASTDALQLTGVNPRRGSYSGGDQVVITGKGIQTPVDVYFDLDGFAYQAIIVGVTPSDPLSADGTITVITPAFTGTNTGAQQTADVRVNTNAGTGSQETDTLPDAFVLLPGGGPQIYGVSPSSGRSSGGEVVNVLGQGFGSVASDLSVSFADPGGVVRLGTVMAVSPDGTQIQVETPRFSTIPLTEDEAQDVTVATIDGVVSLEDAFIVLADEPTPEIASISPIAGPLDGGTLVTIFGSGFQVPVQVTFGGLTALDVNVFNDTTPADNDRITCVTPDYSQQQEVPPVAVDVGVTNVTSGNSASYASFTYGDPLYITGNSPTEGGLGDLVIIYGSGFEDPLQVFLSGNQMEVVSVSGTELVVRIPDDLATECAGSSGPFRVVLLESGLDTEGGNFTLVGNSPTVLSVSPVLTSADVLGNLTPDDFTITGLSFANEVLVDINNNYVMPSGSVTVNSETSIDIQNVPDLGTLGVQIASTDCTLPTGEPGTIASATAIEVGVTNFPGECRDSLRGAIVIEPPNPVCTLTPADLSATPVEFGGVYTYSGSTTVGLCNAATLVLNVTNVGGMDATILSVAVAGVTSVLDFQGIEDCMSSSPLAWNDGCTITASFCPQSAGPLSGAIAIDYNDGTGLVTESIILQGTGVP
ncbi:IPT/TIG domain-containing protein [Acidobacteriota bacterium]